MMPLAPQVTTLDAAIIIVLAAVCFILFLMSLYLFKEVQFLRALIAGIEQAQNDQWNHINGLEKIVILNPELEKKKQKTYNLKC
jgi:hypothetical protein